MIFWVLEVGVREWQGETSHQFGLAAHAGLEEKVLQMRFDGGEAEAVALGIFSRRQVLQQAEGEPGFGWSKVVQQLQLFLMWQGGAGAILQDDESEWAALSGCVILRKLAGDD